MAGGGAAGVSAWMLLWLEAAGRGSRQQMALEAAEVVAPAVVAGVEVPGRRGLVVLGLEAAGASSCQWRTVATAEVVAVVEVAGVEAVGC